MKTRSIAIVLAGAGVLSGCSNVVGGVGDPGEGGGTPSQPPTSDEVDLLLVVDNSSSMADKQAVLGHSIHRLLDGLVNPPCVDASGNWTSQPATPSEACGDGSTRRFQPVRSVHLGVISSSLGAVGADQCMESSGHDNNDDAHLLIRSANGDIQTYLDYGYLAFDPEGALSPPGDADYDHFISTAVDLVQGVGEVGCGYEMPLEAAYRFLVDPNPYKTVVKENPGDAFSPAEKQGIDTDLLAQRERFLRPQSLLGVIILSDENDCSTRVGGQAYAPLNSAGFFKASTVCATNPLDSCCYSCGLPPPSGCTPDPACAGAPRYDANAGEDHVNLRCFHQKQRYGLDMLYPTDRYVNAFSAPTIDPDADDLLPAGQSIMNPLFALGRAPSEVFVASIVGVPWQLIAVDPSDPTQGTQNAIQMSAWGTWDRVLGDPAAYVDASDPSMVESTSKRSGVNPAFNGGDRTIATAPDDLEYACTFPLENSIPNGADCSLPTTAPDNPICQGMTQIAAKAYPGLRELSVIKGLGAQGIVGSICEPGEQAMEMPDPIPTVGRSNYDRAMNAMVDRMATALGAQR